MKKIGISAGLYINNKMFNDYKMTCVANNYMNSVILAGAVPFVLPCIANEDIIEEQLKSLDGIIFSGGEDCSPALYNEETLSKCGRITPERDEADMLFLKKALELKIPILGICRGTQLLNVILGGSLYQDLSYMEEKVFLKHQQEINQALPSHKIKIQKNSFLRDILGEEAWVNSFHHQSIKELASCFKISAKSSDGVIEAYESKSEDYFMLGVQWHPEMMAARGNDKMLELFKKFIGKL
ncbi:gamma-glutamyl-gamma-aminobutyrate hydrolase family protein [uncultured Ilyobacter sp.]|uniref:gamma-glutamyl-gamma-aminobutyrate hydrolase family protein n=1 Tax=uncultured Ilyobacter sp. TaxID=544433 RepID=UPI002AA6B05F|nr:gamma-glutamyl-gamma-aminobutyrate hydrolase family protein [uncultured Ilyobacter sp.]